MIHFRWHVLYPLRQRVNVRFFTDLSFPFVSRQTYLALEAKLEGKDKYIEQILQSKNEAAEQSHEIVQSKDETIESLNRSKDQIVLSMDKVIKMNEAFIVEKNQRINELSKQLLMSQANFGVVSGNRSLVEIGLNALYPGTQSMTSKWSSFAQSHVFDDIGTQTLTKKAKDLIIDLGCDSISSDVASDLVDFYHELSKSHHRVTMVRGEGLVCGGEQPLGCATGLAILLLQDAKALDMEVRFLDEFNRDKRLLRNGKVEPKIQV